MLPLVSWPRVTGGAIVTSGSGSPGDKATQTADGAEFCVEDEQAALLD